MEIRELNYENFDAIWHIVEPIVRAGESYAYPLDASRAELRDIWFYSGNAKVFVALLDDAVVGTYYIKPNSAGPASHTANAGFMTAPLHAGKGIASAMADHMLNQAQELGYHAIQFNMVLEDNIASIKLWKKRGFETVGKVKDVFCKPDGSLKSAYIMHKII